ncbi:MAG: hypothetical protein NBV61_01305 [Algoriphagus sp.]|nr:hypothetical protein [Algoriphagus sp.]
MLYSQLEIIAHFFDLLERDGQCYSKKSLTLAKKATPGVVVLTETSDRQRIETIAKPGDWLVENQTAAKEHYLVSEATFRKKYQLRQALGEGWGSFQSLIPVYALKVQQKDLAPFGNPTQLEFQGPREKTVLIHPGDYLVIPMDQSEAYRITAKEFEETYLPVKEPE